MSPAPPKTARELAAHARFKLGMTQKEFGELCHVSLRTVSRWEHGGSSPTGISLRSIIPALHPVDPLLAEEAARKCGTSLEALGLVKPAAPAAPVPPPAPPTPTRFLVDAVLFAAAEALGSAPPSFESVRAALRTAFARAIELRLDPADVVAALAPAPGADKRAGSGKRQ